MFRHFEIGISTICEFKKCKALRKKMYISGTGKVGDMSFVVQS